jgi:hypothetical protein
MPVIFKRLTFIGLWAFTLNAFAANPSLSWKTHESEHFLIHYPDNLSHFVSKVDALSAKSHKALVPYFNWEPKKKTHVVLLDEVDQANGMATPVPNNTMTLYMQPPTKGELLVYDDWLSMLIHHEYTHILHIDKVIDLPSFLRRVFGRFILLFPNALHPNWFQEGLATYMETDEKRHTGRGQSDIFQMMMRQEVLNGIKPLSRINTVNGHDWPFNSAYLYGVFFFKFIHDVYGEEAIIRLVNNYSNNLLPFRVDSNPRLVTGKTLSELWPEFSTYLTGYFAPQIDRIKSQPQNEYSQLTKDYLAIGLLSQGLDNSIWYSAIDFSQGANLYRYLKNEGKDQGDSEKVIQLNSLASIDINNNGEVLVSQLEYCDQYSQYYDLYLLIDDELQRITHCGRYRLAKWNHQGQIVALKYEGGIAKLDLLARSGEKIATVWQGAEGEILSAFDVSSKGDIAATLKFGKKPWNLYLLEGDIWKAESDDSAIQTNPAFLGDDIFFTQSQLGQLESYKINIQTKLKTRITNTMTGIKQILPNKDVSTAALRYSAKGYQMVSMEQQSYPLLYERPKRKELKESEELVANIDISADQSYSPYESLLPSYWLPVWVNDGELQEVGLFTSGNDALGLHSYLAQLTYEKHHKRPLGNLTYIYNSRWLLGLQKTLTATSFSDSVSELETQVFAGFIYPIMQVQNSFYPYVAYVNNHSEFISEELTLTGDVNLRDNWLALGLIYDGLRSSLVAGDASDGWQASFSMESAEAADNSHVEGHVLSLGVRHYHSFNWGHTLAQRLFVGSGVDTHSTSNFQLGGSRSDAYIGPGIQLKQRKYALRGYENDLLELRGENSAIYNIEYRLPFSWFDHNVMTPPVGFSGWSLRAFIDNGTVWDNGESVGDIYSSLGSELILDNTLFYNLNIRLRLGAAKGLDAIGDETIYMEIGGAF